MSVHRREGASRPVAWAGTRSSGAQYLHAKYGRDEAPRHEPASTAHLVRQVRRYRALTRWRPPERR